MVYCKLNAKPIRLLKTTRCDTSTEYSKNRKNRHNCGNSKLEHFNFVVIQNYMYSSNDELIEF